jgi:hypothetical protein
MKNQDFNLRYILAKNRVEKVKSFYNHLAVYMIVNLVITGFKVSDHLGSWTDFKSEILTINVLSVWTVWGLVLGIHLISVTLLSGWEERKIEAIMKKELAKNKN